MEHCPHANIYELIRNLEIIKHKKFKELICELTKSILKNRSVQF